MLGKFRTPLVLLALVTIVLISANTLETQSAAAAEKAAREIRVATQPIPHYAPIFVAKQKGWLEAEVKKFKVKVKWTSFAAGPPMNEAFAAGEEDIGLLGDTPAIIGRAAGQDTRIIGLSSSGPKALAVVVKKNSAIDAPKDLKGKKVAVTKGSYAHHLLYLVLQSGGLTAEDIQLINLPNGDIGTALARGDIDAGAVWEPQITRWEENDTIRVLADGTKIKKGILVIIATQKFASRNPKLTQAFLKAYKRGYAFINANPGEAAKLITDEVKLPPQQLEKIFARFDYAPGIYPDDIAELKKTETFMLENQLIKSAVNIDTFVDTSYAKAAGIQ